MKRVAIIIPAYNEEDSIAQVIADLKALNIPGYHLTPVVVNDCSKDKTAQIASQLDCVLLDLPNNLGIGGAVQTGIRYAFENQFDYCMQMDGDGQHPANQIPNLIREAEISASDVVIGSRFIEREGFQSSGMRRLGIRYFEFFIRLFIKQTVTDATSGFRLFNKKTIAIAADYYPDEYPEPEALIVFHSKGLKIQETPVHMLERQGGTSSITAFKSLYYMIKVSLAIIYTFIRVKRK